MYLPVFCAQAHAAEKQTLPEPIAKALKKYRLSKKSLGLFVQVVGEDKPVLAFNADAPKNPASAIKVLTTLAALELLRPDYRWQTEFYIDGKIMNGQLQGPLYVRGGGDPYLVLERFWVMLSELWQRGLRDIPDGMVLDGSYFTAEATDPAQFDGRPERAYNLNPSALLANFQSLRFLLMPDLISEKVIVRVDPEIDAIKLQNQLQFSRSNCRRGGPYIDMQPEGMHYRVKIKGHYSMHCGERSIYRALPEATQYFSSLFRKVWKDLGGEIGEQFREGAIPSQARLYHRYSSLPLRDVVRHINKYSNNVMTKQLLQTMGAKYMGEPGSLGNGLAVVKQWLNDKQYNFDELVIENGTGLSRQARISPRHLAEVLSDAYYSPHMPEFMSSLPILAMDGTLRQRFTGTALAGRMHLKTGTLDDVKAVAGYILDDKGRRIVIVSLLNGYRAGTYRGDKIQDEILKWVYFRG